MEANELLNIISLGETSRVQFKERLADGDSIAAEMVAMSNAKGGIILFGIKDKTGEIIGLDYQQLQFTGNRLAAIATDQVKPQIFVSTEVVQIAEKEERKAILVAHIEEGIAKPYKDNQGRIWIKQGPDRRKLTDNHELMRLFQQSGMLYADEMLIPDTTIADIDADRVRNYLSILGKDDLPGISEERIYQNIGLLRNGHLTLGGLLFFNAEPQRFCPAFCVKAVSFFGNEIAGTDYRDSVDITGPIPDMFERCMRFFHTNLLHTQQGRSFNSLGILEISPVALEEIVQNALTHRDYSRNAAVRMFVFDDRVEIISPGALPNNLTLDNIKMGNTVARNSLIVSFASRLMRYRGIGSGILRALKEQPDIEFVNDVAGEQFKVTIPRRPLR